MELKQLEYFMVACEKEKANWSYHQSNSISQSTKMNNQIIILIKVHPKFRVFIILHNICMYHIGRLKNNISNN